MLDFGPIENNTQITLSIDIDGHIEKYNGANQGNFDFSANSFRDIISKGSWDIVYNTLNNGEENQVVLADALILALFEKGGIIRFFKTRIERDVLNSGLYIVSLNDISSELDAMSNATNLSSIIDDAHHASIITSREGLILSSDQVSKEYYGELIENSLGEHVNNLVCSEDKERINNMLFQSQEAAKEIFIKQRGARGDFKSEVVIKRLNNNNCLWVIKNVDYELSQKRFNPLTRLPDRKSFVEHLDAHLNSAHPGGAVILLDIDQFKSINDSFGHDKGDELLNDVASLLKQKTRSMNYLSHLGVDEFAFISNLSNRETIERHVKRLINYISDIAQMNFKVNLHTSVGVVVFSADTKRNADQILSAANSSMYDAKKVEGSRIVFFENDRLTRIDLSQHIRHALEQDFFTLYEQPIVDLKTGKTVQRELLLRLDDPELGVLTPDKFLPSAETLGLIGEVDRWVIRKGVLESIRGGSVEINLSGQAMTDVNTLNLIQAELKNPEVNPENIIFEITETSAISSIDDAAVFARSIKETGAGFALDDFGTGFGSFTYLKHLPVSVIKIDGDFINNSVDDLIDQRIIQAIVHIAKGMKMKTVAECVNNKKTLTQLTEWGVDYAQGYFIGKPVPIL